MIFRKKKKQQKYPSNSLIQIHLYFGKGHSALQSSARWIDAASSRLHTLSPIS